MNYQEPLTDLFKSSRLMILDFNQIPRGLPEAENIKAYFTSCVKHGVDPRLPANRQAFNNQMLDACRARYLVSRYAEDRRAMLVGSQIAAEGRTLHLGVDVFARDLETVLSPCDGQVVITGREEGTHSYGYYLILRPFGQKGQYIFLGHLSRHLPAIGIVQAGQPIARLGDYADNENGGWSRHLHLQVIKQLPRSGKTPNGYAARRHFLPASHASPNPMALFPDWSISSPL